jgi:hypothetical protein
LRFYQQSATFIQMKSASQIPPSALVLGLAGLLPFLACALSQWIAIPLLPPADGLRFGMAYGAAILSFLGGIRWGTALSTPETSGQGLEFALSAVSSFMGWVSLLLSPLLGLSLLIAGFLLQSLWDVLSTERGRLPQWFGRLRMILTIGAVISLAAMLVRLVIS